MNKGKLPLTEIITTMTTPIAVYIEAHYKNAHSAQESILNCAQKIGIPVATTICNDHIIITRLDRIDQYHNEFYRLFNMVTWG